jgi:hypothetical protein
MIKLTDLEFKQSREQYIGYCLECGAERDCCEPDAVEYECYSCGAMQVFGAEELFIMGELEFVD